MNPTSIIRLAFLINYIIGQRPPDLPLSEVRTAARRGLLLRLLANRYGHIADFYYLVRKGVGKPAILEQIEAALADAAAILTWGESRRIGASSSGLCLAQAIVLEAIQEQFHRPWPPEPPDCPNPALPASWTN